jgi:predicted nucleotidyltransferase
MGKQEIKEKVREAIENASFKEDIQKVSLFGSYLHGNAKNDSDVDVLVEFTPGSHVGLFKYIEIQNTIEDHIKKKVDLLTPEGLSKFFRDDVINEAELIYGK